MQCETRVESTFDACWNCGASIDGLLEPEFRHADDWVPEIPEYKRQFSLAELLLISTAIATTVAGWTTQNATLLVAGASFLLLMSVCSGLPNLIHKYQQRIRSSNHGP